MDKEEFMKRFTKEQVIQQVEKLPEKVKLVLSLHWYERLSFGEISKIIERSEAHVKSAHDKAVENILKGLTAI